MLHFVPLDLQCDLPDGQQLTSVTLIIGPRAVAELLYTCGTLCTYYISIRGSLKLFNVLVLTLHLVKSHFVLKCKPYQSYNSCKMVLKRLVSNFEVHVKLEWANRFPLKCIECSL